MRERRREGGREGGRDRQTEKRVILHYKEERGGCYFYSYFCLTLILPALLNYRPQFHNRSYSRPLQCPLYQ